MLAEKVCDIIEQHPVMTEKNINEQIRSHDDIQDAFAHSTEKWESKSNGEASRNRPAQQVEKAYDMLDTIDTNIFQKLTDVQKDDVRSKLDLVQQTLDNIRSELDV